MRVTIESIIYHNSTNNYYVANAITDDDIITITGYFDDLIADMDYEIEAQAKHHPSYGIQYVVTSYRMLEPVDVNQICDYLSSGIFQGIGVTMAQRIVAKFQEETLDIMKNSPEKLLQVTGIGKATLKKIMKSYDELNDSRDTLFFLNSLGLSVNQSHKIYNIFKDNTRSVINKNPFEIIKRVQGIGFLTIDKMSEKLGVEKNSKHRVSAVIMHFLSANAQNGHMYLEKNELYSKIIDHINRDNEAFELSLEELYLSNDIMLENKADGAVNVYNISMYHNEIGIVRELVRILTAMSDNLEFSQNYSEIELSEEQLQAVNKAFDKNVFILTGGPGTGKTTILKELVMRLNAVDKKFALAAPTGRAANRLEELTGSKASTIHRLLEYTYLEDDDFLYFQRNSENPLDADVVIIDEVSMLDSLLFLKLLEAIKTGSKLILIGDFNQLPSVGPGSVLLDLINSCVINTSKLTQIHRQAAGSLIIKNAHAILSKAEMEFNSREGDFFFIEALGQMEVQRIVVDLVKNRLPKYYQIDPFNDICVLSPTKIGNLGTQSLNEVLQESLNAQNSKKFMGKFWIGDKVMQTKNDYNLEWQNYDTLEEGKGVFNGEIGFVTKISDFSLRVRFSDGKIVDYTSDNINHLILAYSITIHKSQGNEFDYCIIPILNVPPLLKNRNLIYTGITRAKKHITIVGSRQSFQEMINEDRQNFRNTSLADKLKSVGFET